MIRASARLAALMSRAIFGDADDLAGSVAHRRHGQRYFDLAAILAQARRFAMLDRLALPHQIENVIFLGLAVFGNEQRR